MAPRRSRADPGELARFATTTLDALATLRLRSDAVTRDLDALAAAGGEGVPARGSVAVDLADLVGDWEHLGGFARDVANGFYWLLGEAGYHGGVITFRDSSLAGAGTIGFADRDAAIAAAEEMARRFRALRDEGYDGLDPEAVWDLLDLADRGRYDPAFAVAFSEAIGVEGYVDLTAMIRTAYQRAAIHEPVPSEGLEGIEVLATTLSTALATLPGLPAGEGSPATATWSRGERLDRDLLDDLARGFDPDEGRSNTDFPVRTDTDLSVLISFTAPPTSVAVAIANGRLSPMLRDTDVYDARPGDEGDDWGDHGGRITNYATMLARDPDASAQWLDTGFRDGTHNIDLVLRRNPDFADHEEGHDIDVDGGRTLAEVVEQGVTHPDDAVRGRLMERAIEVVGGRQDEIRNPHLPDALAEGVAHNMDVVDGLVLDGWDDPHSGEAPPRSTRNTHDFLVEVMKDDSAGNRALAALEKHSLERLRALPPPGIDADGDRRFDRSIELERIGMVEGVFVGAEGNVISDSVEDYIARQEQRADAVNFTVGLIPYAEGAIGTVNDLADVYGVSVGEVLTPEMFRELDEAEQVTLMVRTDAFANNRALVYLAEHPEVDATPIRELTADERREWIERIRPGAHAYDSESLLNAGMGYPVVYFDAERWSGA